MNDPIDLKDYANQLDTQMRKGFLVYCVLLICSHGNVYSSDIIKRLRDASLVVVEGTIYPLLNRLQKDGLLLHEWKESSQGPPRKYYRVSADGQKVLEELKKTNAQLQVTINKIDKE
jgi:PadR family transcriptional regulator, regulatory protein PadR